MYINPQEDQFILDQLLKNKTIKKVEFNLENEEIIMITFDDDSSLWISSYNSFKEICLPSYDPFQEMCLPSYDPFQEMCLLS